MTVTTILVAAVVVLVGMTGLMAVALAGALERQEELRRRLEMMRRLQQDRRR